MGLIPGLCSVSFRALAPDDVLAVAVDAGLKAIEWGGDVHVPPGDTDTAETVARWTTDAGLSCPSYGSYLFAGQADADDVDRVCDTTLALGATTVRLWCPFGSGPASPAGERRRVTAALGDLARHVLRRGLEPALEFHPGTLTETAASTRSLLDHLAIEGLTTYWQPAPGASPAQAVAEYEAVADAVSNLHVFWWGPGSVRRRLAEGADAWVPVLARAASVPGPDRAAYLEFVPDDDPALLAREAATLRTWVGLAAGREENCN